MHVVSSSHSSILNKFSIISTRKDIPTDTIWLKDSLEIWWVQSSNDLVHILRVENFQLV